MKSQAQAPAHCQGWKLGRQISFILPFLLCSSIHQSGLRYCHIIFPAILWSLEKKKKKKKSKETGKRNQETEFSVVRASTAPCLLSTCDRGDKLYESATFLFHDNVAKLEVNTRQARIASSFIYHEVIPFLCSQPLPSLLQHSYYPFLNRSNFPTYHFPIPILSSSPKKSI